MRIVNSVLGDATGGRWQVVCDYSRMFSGQGHSVLMLLSSNHAPDASLIPPGVEVEAIRNRGHYDYPAAWRARRQLRLFAPDIAIAHCSRSVALLRRALAGTAPLVAVSHSNKVRRLLGADAFLALTAHIEEQIRSQSRGNRSRPCFIIPNMVQIPDTGPLLPMRRHQPVRIGALGRFDVVKGFDVFVEALGLLKARDLEFEAVLAGAGLEENALRNQVDRLGLGQQAEFPGWVQDTAGFFAGLDMLCVPARSDAFGLTPLQAAAAGVPLLLSRASGHREMFNENHEALFCNIGDSAATALQLARLLASPELAENLRQAAYQRVNRCYSEAVITEKIIQAIDYIYRNSIL
ncbi:MAG: glycosyltransferase [Thiogranum sp.]|nr:glycosyltransferase [Thiogranum sp.]